MSVVSDLCRLCARTCCSLVPVFSEEGLSKRIADKVHAHLPIVMTAEDCLPTAICVDCLKAVEVSHNLLRICLDADIRLRHILHFPEDEDHMKAMTQLRKSYGIDEEDNVLHSTSEREKVQSSILLQDSFPYESSALNAEEDWEDASLTNSEAWTLFQCEKCFIRFSSSDLLLEHRISTHNVRGPSSDTAAVLQSCIQHASSDACCEITTNSSTDAQSTEPSSQNDVTIYQVCDSSEMISEESKHMRLQRNHQANMNAQKKGKHGVECRVCGEHFDSFWYLARHRSDAHTKEELAVALQQQGLDRENFECHVCGKLLSCQYTLKHHLLAHKGVKNFHCTLCNRSFVYKAQLKSHLITHTGGPYSCTDCPKQFRNAFALRVHKRTHTGEKPFPCGQCSKAFHSRANYEQHILVHSNIRKYKCTVCPYRARRPEALRTHVRVHTNERPYVCKECGRAFKQKYDCKKHEILHTKKPGLVIKPRGARHTPEKISIEAGQECEVSQSVDYTRQNVTEDGAVLSTEIIPVSTTMILQ